MPALPCQSYNSPEADRGHAWPDDFLSLPIESELVRWAPLSRNVEGHDQSASACLPWDDIEGDTPAAVFTPLSTTETFSSTTSLTSSPWQDQEDDRVDSSLFPTIDELHMPNAGISGFPMNDEELSSFFGCPTTSVCSNFSSPPPVLHLEDDVVFVKSQTRRRSQQKRRSQKKCQPHKRLPRKIATSTIRHSYTKWNHVFLRLHQAGYLPHGADRCSEDDEVFHWNRYKQLWERRHVPHQTTTSHDLFDPEFYFTVRPGGDGLPIDIHWDEQKQVFVGIDEVNEKTLRLDYNFVWELMSNPDKSRLLEV